METKKPIRGRGRAMVVVALLPSLLALLYVREWRTARAERQDVTARLTAVDARAREFETRRRVLDGKLDASLRSLAEQIRLLRSESATYPDTAVLDGMAESAGEPEGIDRAQPDDENLPPLPPLPGGKGVEQVVRHLSLEDLLRESEFNPEDKWLTPQEFGRGHALLGRARARIDMLRSEIKLRVIDGMEELRAEGAYVEYAPWQRYETIPGVLTAAEETESGGTRMFYYYPEDFPEIYEWKAECREVAGRALRHVQGLIATSTGRKMESRENG